MKPSEVTHINRQKYMAELSKLLAFMFKEDKEDILAQYNKMLDETDDEQALLESFGSPTKLAITISRTYKRSERKLAVEADSKEEKPAATEHIIVTPVKKEKETPPVVDTGLSYADIIEEIRREKAAEEGVEYKPMFFDEPEQPTAEETPVEEIPEVEPVEETPEESSEEEQAAEPSPDEEEPAPEEAEAEDSAAGTEEPEASSNEVEEAPENESTVVEETQGEKAEAEPEETPVEEAADEAEQPEEPAEEPTAEAELVFEEIESVEIPEETVRYKTNAALLILYLIFAIPIGLVLLALALAVTLALLGLGVLVIVIGARFIAFAFAKLVIFADVMLCAGAALIAFAVALIILWLGILMLVRGIKGVVGGVVSVGRKFCVKEVPVNG